MNFPTVLNPGVASNAASARLSNGCSYSEWFKPYSVFFFYYFSFLQLILYSENITYNKPYKKTAHIYPSK